ncbi:MAG: hypothetical protein HYU59_11550 [Magnetospirillum gryphiswaldense]|nr:hypothetical protein [Magnetospirillum gryphiswaldense]
MIEFHTPTAMVSMGVLLVVLGLMFQGGWKSGELYAPSRQWAPAAILFGLGIMLIGLRGSWPAFLSIIMANASLVGGVCLLHRGVAIHVGVPPTDRWYAAALTGLFIAFLWFTYANPDAQSRIALLSTLMALFLGHTFLLLKRTAPSFAGRLFLWTLAPVTLLFAFRALIAGAGAVIGKLLIPEGAMQTVNIFVVSTSAVVMVAAQYRLEAERVRAALAAEAETLRQDRDRLEEIVAERTAELSRSNAELEQFAYAASHDLRQPLRMVSAYLGLIDRRQRDMLDDEGRDFIDFALQGARRMDSMITVLLDYSRIGHGGHPLESVPVGEAVAAAMANLADMITASGAKIEVAPDLPTIKGAPMEILRLFQNLLVNSLKYVAPGVLPHIRISCQSEDGAWLISVTDNGIGIPVDSAERMFAIFQRGVERSLYDGSGIGLSICRKVVESHGGSIWVEPAEGGGSTFQIRLPDMAHLPSS